MLLSAAQKEHEDVKAIAEDTYAHCGFSNVNCVVPKGTGKGSCIPSD